MKFTIKKKIIHKVGKHHIKINGYYVHVNLGLRAMCKNFPVAPYHRWGKYYSGNAAFQWKYVTCKVCKKMKHKKKN